MSERHNPHNGRDLNGHFRVRQADLDDTLEDPAGTDIVRDDVRLGGAVADVGPRAGRMGERIEQMVEGNRDDVARVTGRETSAARRKGGRGRR